MPRDPRAPLRVGALLLAAAAVAGVAIFLLGERQNLFRAHNRYSVRFNDVSGLQPGAMVQLNGVRVGEVERIVLPEDMGQTQLVVGLEIDSRYEQRIRMDSQARIKTLGLLGDKYVEITSGSPAATMIPEDGEIPAAAATNVEQFVASGEDLMANVLRISSQLTTILGRMERGEGLLGELTVDVEPGRNVSTELYETLATLRRVAEKVENGPGAVPRLLDDAALGDKLADSIGRLDSLLTRADAGEGAAGVLLTKKEPGEQLERTFAALDRVSAQLEVVAQRLEEQQALIPKLLADEAYGKKLTADLEKLLANLAVVSDKLANGEGTAAKLIDDPALYQALNDIVLGVNESKMLRWLIRNRQQKGIERRYDDARDRGEAPPASALPKD
jgi:phospholipid/cholesterol/gamma-HCH transport system substrate-binding protein